MNAHDVRFAIHPEHFKTLTTSQLREHFLLDKLFVSGSIQNTYTHYDRLIVGGAMPDDKPLSLLSFVELKSDFYLQRRELGIINVGADGSVVADGKLFELKNKEALYLGRGTKDVTFNKGANGQALYYFNSAPAHATYPARKISLNEGESVQLGTTENANVRTVRKLIVNSIVPTCQLQMGMTELKNGSIWNTMPPHTHTRRMEAYFYFDVPEKQAVCHFIGQPDETRHIWMKNNEAVLSPPWSIHSGAGTASYTFIWGMAGENLDYGDMDGLQATDLR